MGLILGNRIHVGRRKQGSLLNYEINLVVEGHSFMTQARGVDNYISGIVLSGGYYNSAADGSTVANLVSRQATVDSKLSSVSGVKNVLALWIGVNEIGGGVIGSGTTAYNAMKAYVQNRITSGWNVFAYTCTPTNQKGDAVQFEIERNAFNDLMRNDLSLLSGVHIMDTDTINELDDYTNTTYYADNLHLTWGGSGLAGQLFENKVSDVYGLNYITKAITESFINLSLAASGDGSALATLELVVSERLQLKLTGGAKFYMDISGTICESDHFTVTPSSAYLRKIYIKCATGASVLMVEKNKISQLRTWTSPTNAPTLGGEITKLSDLTRIAVQGKNTLTGNLSLFDKIDLIEVSSNATSWFQNGTASPTLCYYVSGIATLTSEQVNALLASAWLNKDVAKNYALRYLDLRGSVSSGAPTGQGLIDKANLQAYRTPNMEADKALWTVLTR